MQIALILLEMMQFTLPKQQEGAGKQKYRSQHRLQFSSHKQNGNVYELQPFAVKEDKELGFFFNPYQAW